MPYVWTAPPVVTASDSNAPPLSHDTREWFPRVTDLVTPEPDAAGATGPGDEDDDESDGGVGNIDPDDDEGYDDDDEDDEEDTLWAVPAASASPPKRA